MRRCGWKGRVRKVRMACHARMRLLLLEEGPATFKARRGTGNATQKSRAAKAAWRSGGSAKVCIAMWRDGHGLSIGRGKSGLGRSTDGDRQ